MKHKLEKKPQNLYSYIISEKKHVAIESMVVSSSINILVYAQFSPFIDSWSSVKTSSLLDILNIDC